MIIAYPVDGALPRILLSLVLCALFACGGNTRAPVEDRVAQSHSTHSVMRGDTLYSIAFRYGLDYRKVAAANGIEAPYTIYPGQYIRLKEVALIEEVRAPTTPEPAVSPKGRSESPYTPVPGPAAPVPIATAPVTQTKSPVRESPPSPPAAPVKPPPAGAKPAGTYVGGKVGAWRWPASGTVTRGYSGSVHKGIDISGTRGDPVAAVAAGKVVYAGTGIVGFGELLIVKHNEVYLSAYGHNDQLLVAEGEVVTAGQTIAHKGSSGTDTVKLHFEIRKEGKPIDPQRLLPRR